MILHRKARHSHAAAKTEVHGHVPKICYCQKRSGIRARAWIFMPLHIYGTTESFTPTKWNSTT